MTTPERIRRRQRRESAFIAVLALALVFSSFWFDEQDDMQRECLYNYIESDSQTTAIRADLVMRESQSFRDVIRGAGTATSRQEFEAALNAAEAEWAMIDEKRAENKPVVFDPEVDCPQ